VKVTREMIQERERAFLAPYAVKSSESRGRKIREEEDDTRTAFQRDRDRIVHSTAFRRLQYKTQVFVYDEGDHYRTRLTHTLETSQIARSIGRALGLNEDLIEAVALAHDLGHGPFGHAGEWALQEMMAGHGGFEHNEQSVRIVEKLEERCPGIPGLNLTQETLDGLRKHHGPGKQAEPSPKCRSLEAEVVDAADEISYICHDLDDGLRSELLEDGQAQAVRLWRDACREAAARYGTPGPAPKRRLAIRVIIDKLVKGLIRQSAANLRGSRISSLGQLRENAHRWIALPAGIEKQAAQLKLFLRGELYQHNRIVRMTDKGQRFLKALFQAYLDRPSLLPPESRLRGRRDGIRRVVCDYLAGMTDRFAIDEYKRFFEPDERV
jgi:dGTPase